MRRRIVGCGSLYRRDDGVGLSVARRLAALELEGTQVLACPGDGALIFDLLRGAGEVVLIDAMRSGRRPGSLAVFHPLHEPLPSGQFFSSHGMGLGYAVGLAKSLEVLPRDLLIYGIEGADFSCGDGLTPVVEAAAARLTSLLWESYA